MHRPIARFDLAPISVTMQRTLACGYQQNAPQAFPYGYAPHFPRLDLKALS
jgi:hypothetical protein